MLKIIKLGSIIAALFMTSIDAESPPMQYQISVYPEKGSVIKEHFPYTDSHQLVFSNLSPGIDPESIVFLSENTTSWTYSNPVENKQQLLSTFIGRTVSIQNDDHRITGILEHSTNDMIIIRSDDERIVNPEGNLIIHMDSDSNHTMLPQLHVESTKGPTTFLYFTESLTGIISHHAVFNDAQKTLTLQPFILIKNDSPITYRNVQMSVIAGDVNRLPQAPSLTYSKRLQSDSRSREMIGQKSALLAIDDIYTFQLNGDVTLPPNRLSSYPLTSPIILDVKKTYRFSNSSPYGPEQTKPQAANHILRFKNMSEYPIPSGKIQILSDNTLVGYAMIENTPIAGNAMLSYGNTMDITLEKKIRKTKKDGERDNTYYVVNLICTNYKTSVESIEIVEDIPISGEWHFNKASHPYTKVGKNSIRFDVKLAPEDTIQIEYEILKQHHR